jgi:hypothetical protein
MPKKNSKSKVADDRQLQKKLRKKAKKAKPRQLEEAVERNGHHAREKKSAVPIPTLVVDA